MSRRRGRRDALGLLAARARGHGLIFVLSSQSGLRVSEDVAVDKPFRITGHLLAYGTLAALPAGRAQLGPATASRVTPLVALRPHLAYAVIDEWHQSFVPDRTGRLDDVVTDAIGALVGAGGGLVVLTSWRR